MSRRRGALSRRQPPSLDRRVASESGYPPPLFQPLAIPIPLFKLRQGVEWTAALIPTGWPPHLEVEMAGRRVAGLADDADRLASADGFAGMQRRRFGEVGVHEVVLAALAVDHQVISGRVLVAGVL